MKLLAAFLLGILVALLVPVEAHKAHTTPRCPMKVNARSGAVRVAKYIRCAAKATPRVSVSKALQVARCESGYNPRAVGGAGELGVYQHMPQYWPTRARTYGFPRHSGFDPRANIWVTMRIVRDSGWGMWTCA